MDSALHGSDEGPGILRWLLLALVAWWTARLATGAASWCFADFVNLAFHEAGHVFLRPFGSFLHYLGGTVFQLAVPAILIGYFLTRRPEPLGAAFAGWWFGESLVNVSIYMADARALDLPLVGGGDHDWNELFYRLGLLGEDSVKLVSGLTRGLGVVIMVGGLLWIAAQTMPPRWRDGILERWTRLRRRVE